MLNLQQTRMQHAANASIAVWDTGENFTYVPTYYNLLLHPQLVVVIISVTILDFRFSSLHIFPSNGPHREPPQTPHPLR